MIIIKQTHDIRWCRTNNLNSYKLYGTYKRYKSYCHECNKVIWIKKEVIGKDNICVKCSNRKNAKTRKPAKLSEASILSKSIKMKQGHKDGLFDSRKLPYKQASFNALLNSYTREAQERGYVWKLTIEQFKEITSKNCYYCGLEPKQISHGKSRMNGNYEHNGIDRKNNDIGYIYENCVPCCKECNFAKRKMKETDFINMVKRIYEYQLKKLDTKAQS